MRDGIHRTLPIPPSWQRVVKFADRAADREKRLEDALKNAIFEDFRRFIPKRVGGHPGKCRRVWRTTQFCD